MRIAHLPGMPWIALALCALGALPSHPAAARPDEIRAGQRYYSDAERIAGFVRDLGPEKNLEEVYQNYRYFEAVYDTSERVIVFRSYLRGELECTERYRYHEDGALAERSVERPGRPPELTLWPGADNAPTGAGVESSPR